MKTLLSLFFLLVPFISLAQPQAILRNAMSTNIAGTPVLSRNDLSITNVGGGTNWQFYGKTSNTVARLAEIDAARAYAESLAGAGSHFFFYGSLNAGSEGSSLAVGPASLTNWALPDPSSGATVLSSVSVTASDQYIVAYASTQTFSAVLAGSAEVNIYLYENSPGSLSVNAEFYAYDTVDVSMTELGVGQPQAVTATGVPYQNMVWIVPISGLDTGNPLRFVVKLKSSSVLLTPTLVLVTEGTYGSHMSVGVPLNLASKVDTLNGRATNLFVSALTSDFVVERATGVDLLRVPFNESEVYFPQGLTVGADATLAQAGAGNDLISSLTFSAPQFRLTERESIIADTTNFSFVFWATGNPAFPVRFLPFGGVDGFFEYDDFTGGNSVSKLAWSVANSGTGAGAAMSAPAGNSFIQPGQIRLGNGSTAGGRSIIFLATHYWKNTTNIYWQEWSLYAPPCGDFLDSSGLQVGIATQTGGGYHTDGCWWQFDTNNANWGFVCANNSTFSVTNYYGPVAADNWVRLGLFWDGPNSSVTFYTNGAAAGSITTGAALMYNRQAPIAMCRHHNATGSTARYVYVDYFRHAMNCGTIQEMRK